MKQIRYLSYNKTYNLPSSDSHALVKVSSIESNIFSLKLANKPVNALDSNMIRAITQSIKDIEEHSAKPSSSQYPNAAVIIDSDLQNVFSAGLALEAMMMDKNAPKETGIKKIRSFWTDLQEMWITLYSSKLSTIGCATGHAPAGGCLILMCCDARVGVKSSKFRIGLNEAQFGLVAPVWFAEPLANCVGVRKADRMLQLGEMLTFDEALNAGLFDELCDTDDQARAKAVEYAKTWVKNGFPEAKYRSKMINRRKIVDDLKNNREKDCDYFLEVAAADHTQQSLNKYLEGLKASKKKPAAKQ